MSQNPLRLTHRSDANRTGELGVSKDKAGKFVLTIKHEASMIR